MDIKWAWSSSRRGHQVGVVIKSAWSSSRRGHQVGVVIKSAWSSSRRGHQVGVVIKSDDSPSGDPWFDSRSGPLLNLFLVVSISNPQERL